jgi:hypothetical protein
VSLTVAVLVVGAACSSDKAPALQSPTSASSASVSALGEFTSVADLTATVRTAIASKAPSRGGLHLCSVVANLVYANTAVLNGDAVIIEVFGEPGHQQISIDKASTCEAVATEAL